MNRFSHFSSSAAWAAVIMLVCAGALHAQPGPSISTSYDIYPYARLSNADTSGGNAYLDSAEIRSSSASITASYPVAFSEGRTMLTNEFTYKNVLLEYQGFRPTDTNPEHLHSVEYSATIMHQFSDRWSLLSIMTPGIASDFEGSLGRDDVTFQAVAVFIRAYSERLQVGYGAAWSNTFGQPFPLPVLAVQWNNGSNIRISSILPANLEAWYAPSQRLELGLQLSVDGNRYHGDPDIYAVNNPLVSYSVGTVGPALNYHLSEGTSVGLSAGRTFTRRFEFFDGGKDVQDVSLENSNFIKVQVQIGL